MAKIDKEFTEKLRGKRILPVITGPTASGKTAVSIALSKLMDIEIISADSRQIFKYLNIGTATPSKEELSIVKTHFINIIRPDEYYSAGLFAKQAQKKIERIYSQNKVPIVVGGSGLYIKALCEGIFDEDNMDMDNIDLAQKYKELEKLDNDYLYDELMKVDEKSAKLYIDKNPRRIIRALAYYQMTGMPFSDAHEKFQKSPNLNPLYFGIDYPREILYNRINQRSEIIWKTGLIKELKSVLSRGFAEDLNSLNTVGYKEALTFLKNESTEIEALEKMKQNTRRYAKRQITWFKKIENMTWLRGNEKEIASTIFEILKKI